MKYIIIIATLLMSNLSFIGAARAAETNDDWKSQAAQTAQEVIQTIRDVAPEVTESLVRYTWMNAMVTFASAMMLMIASAFMLHSALKKEDPDSYRNYDSVDGLLIFGILAACTGFIMAAVSLPTVLEPEGSLAMDVLKSMQGSR